MPESAQSLRARFLVGPTASGKTSVAQWIAEAEGGDILSADSMLVYRGMDIGTAKPSLEEQSRVRYHGMDLVSSFESFSVWDYRVHALRALSLCASEALPVLVVGGTGLYVKSLTEGLHPAPAPNPELRAHWTGVVEREGLTPLREELSRRYPTLYAAIKDKSNFRRLLRALELGRAGIEEKPSAWRSRRQDAPLAGLLLSPELLKSRIELRVAEMYRQGLLDEVQTLLDLSEGLSPVARKGIGYEEALGVIQGECSTEEARQRTCARTWQLARRQMTWFRHQAAVEWIEVEAGERTPDIARRVLAHWSTYGPTTVIG